ncbi:hypothetical protein IC229_22590 [Spirosoma sp. BT702]|uniref:Uncharacterized protein n=1 Tax=Spirosoma profusum TaxID=2771354 RepID=A0A926Y017_9BACT|nr:hypothetical protein [Spirosoma profusum]MBD2703450.1 hypothetical protein [Spirosoma profusum]
MVLLTKAAANRSGNVTNGSFLQSTQNDAVIIGTNVAQTPSGYKLFVEDGILTEK